MGVERGPQLERFRCARKLVDPEEMPVIAALIRNLKLVVRDVKGGPLPPIGGLHLDKTLPAFGRETGDVIAGAIAILLRDPANPPCQVLAAALPQGMDLMAKHALFAGMAQSAVALIPASHVETLCNALRVLQIFRGRCVA